MIEVVVTSAGHDHEKGERIMLPAVFLGVEGGVAGRSGRAGQRQVFLPGKRNHTPSWGVIADPAVEAALVATGRTDTYGGGPRSVGRFEEYRLPEPGNA